MEKSKFEGLTRDNVAFRLRGKFQASFAAKALKNFGEPILPYPSEILYNPKADLMEYLRFYAGDWLTAKWIASKDQTVLQISDLEPFLQYLGCKPKITQETLDQIDHLHAEETTDYVTSKKIGPDEPINNKKINQI